MMRRRQLLELGASMAASTLVRPGFADEALLQHLGTPQDLGTPLEVLDRLITPNPLFFVRSHFGPPALDTARKLQISGLVRRPLSLDLTALRRFHEVTTTAVLQCAGNGRALQSPRVPGVQWIHGAMGQATWTGVRLRDVLDRAGVVPGAAHVRLVGA